MVSDHFSLIKRINPQPIAACHIQLTFSLRKPETVATQPRNKVFGARSVNVE